MPGQGLSRAQIAIAAILFSTGGAAVKGCGLTAWQIAGFRCAVAGAALYLLLPEARRLGRLSVWVVGAAYAGCLTLYVLASKLTTAANTTFLQSTAPLYVLLLSPIVLKERLRWKDLTDLALVALGMALFFVGVDEPTAIATHPELGNLLAAFTGIFWALVIVGLRYLQRDGGENVGPSAVVAGSILASAVALPMAFPLESTVGKDWAVVAYLGLIQVGLAYSFLNRGLRRLPAVEVSLLLLLEPVLNPVWAWIVHGEKPGMSALAGGLLILGASLRRALAADRQSP